MIVLDEPTAGVDVELRQAFGNSSGGSTARATIILTTHYLEAEALCGRIALMKQGAYRRLGYHGQADGRPSRSVAGGCVCAGDER